MPELAVTLLALAAAVVGAAWGGHPRGRHRSPSAAPARVRHRSGGGPGPAPARVPPGGAEVAAQIGEDPVTETAIGEIAAVTAIAAAVARELAPRAPDAAPPPQAPAPTSRPGRTRLFAHGTRSPGAGAAYRHRGPYAALGIATTGLSPVKDRLIEIAVVRLDPAGRCVDEWSTLLRPGGAAVGLGFLHGLTASDLEHAPAFPAVARHVLYLLEGCVVVAHNADLVEQFLAQSFLRAGVLAPSLPAICTFRWSQQTFPTRNHRLTTIATQLRLPCHPTVSAIDDARAVAGILPYLLTVHEAALAYPIPPAPDPATRPEPAPQARRAARPTRHPVDPWLAGVFATVSTSAREANDPRAAAYVEALASVLRQGRIATGEARELARLIAEAGYPASDIRVMLERLLESVREAAFASSARLSLAQLRQLRVIAASVGVPEYFDDLLPPPPVPAPAHGPGSFARPVRKPPVPAPARAPRCGRCLAVGHYTATCPRPGGRHVGPIAPIGPVEAL